MNDIPPQGVGTGLISTVWTLLERDFPSDSWPPALSVKFPKGGDQCALGGQRLSPRCVTRWKRFNKRKKAPIQTSSFALPSWHRSSEVLIFTVLYACLLSGRIGYSCKLSCNLPSLSPFLPHVLAGSPARGEDVVVCVKDINQPSLPTPFYSVLVSISVFMALSSVFHSINSPDNFPLSYSVLPILILPKWSFQLYTISLWKSLSALL